ncbi:response regulator [Pseudoduganella namucuonensis]|uniref:Two component transcriptional regulator, winged helix family n=1 Tax=Pseudoduganella namucuonensis TaxID=1035707 RepID=A0A1I7L1M8_9BURK|nr:response regulator [Pseudoduganella namucuonensis]SFV03577.1 two component transcriptional regulator, winged helix family [Pseudoduganella namucuonensis]
MTKLMLVEDDARLSSLIAEYLSGYEFEVEVVARGDEALPRFHAWAPDIAVLDLMLPGADGTQVCRALRAVSALPILVLTAREDSYDQVALLEYGADDFVNKPVQPRVLLARLRALMRRAAPAAGAPAAPRPAGALAFGMLEIVHSDRAVHWRGQPVTLSNTEYKLLLVLAESAGTVLSRDALLKKMRGIEFDGLDRSIDNSISKLRRKFDDHEGEKIKTVWGEGYLFSPSAWG